MFFLEKPIVSRSRLFERFLPQRVTVIDADQDLGIAA
jgi:hypothetical protein